MLVGDSRPGCVQPRKIESRFFQRPPRCAVPAAEPAPHVLVRIDEKRNAVPLCLFHDCAHVVEIALVIDAGALVLDCLPGDQEAQEGEAPGSQPSEMLVGLVERKGASHE